MSQPPPLEDDNSAEDVDYILEKNIVGEETSSIVKHPAVKAPVASGSSVPEVPLADSLFVPKDLGFSLFSFSSLLSSLEPPAVALVKGF